MSSLEESPPFGGASWASGKSEVGSVDGSGCSVPAHAGYSWLEFSESSLSSHTILSRATIVRSRIPGRVLGTVSE